MTFDPQLAPEIEDVETCNQCDEEAIDQDDFRHPRCYHHYMIDMEEDIAEARHERRMEARWN